MTYETYLAIDPGGTCGWAIFSSITGRPTSMGECSRGAPFFKLLESSDVDFYVVENYRIRPDYDRGKKLAGFSHKWNEALTARDIGAVELWAHIMGRPIILQEPSIKPLAAKRFGLPNNPSHQMNAVLHGAFYAWKELNLAPSEPESGRTDTIGPGIRRPARVALISGYSGLRKAGSKASIQMPKGDSGKKV